MRDCLIFISQPWIMAINISFCVGTLVGYSYSKKALWLLSVPVAIVLFAVAMNLAH